MRLMLLVFAALLLAVAPAQAGDKDPIEVTAELVEIPGKFPPDDLYDYAYVMKYKVQGGKLDGKTILVAHYKPRRARKKIKDQMKKHVGGKLKKFKQGDVHVMTIDPDLQKIWQGAVIDDFFAIDRKSTRYWCLKVDPKK
jgi:hypothetical protein